MRKKAIFIAATGQNVGKTTICLGMIGGLKKKFPHIGFMKPLGQQHERVENNLLVDKDVILFKEYFQLPTPYDQMSPFIFSSGVTRDFLDQKIERAEIERKILRSFERIYSSNDFTIVEGTGHVGVGSIIELNNAAVASLLDLEVVLIVKGGIGSAFDELALNKASLDQQGVRLRGVILNRVLDEKSEIVAKYIEAGLKRWNVPLIGSIPYNHFLGSPSLEDFELLFKTKLLSGEEFHYRHFETIRLVATSLETFKELILPNQLIVTPATREDIVMTLIERSQTGINHALILTGRHPPSAALIENLKKANLPCLYAAKSSFLVMQMITSFTAKTRKEDVKKVKKAIQLVEENLDFSLVL